MAIDKSELMNWLESVPDDALVAIDEGGLALVVVDREDSHWIEVGGNPNDSEWDGGPPYDHATATGMYDFD
jgi:hypothetical protein